MGIRIGIQYNHSKKKEKLVKEVANFGAVCLAENIKANDLQRLAANDESNCDVRKRL